VVAAEIGVNARRIGVTALLVAALGAYLYFYEVPQAEKEGKKEKLLGVDKDTITDVVLTYTDRTIDLHKTDQGWRLTKPVDAPADDAAIKALLGTLADTEVQKTLDLPTDLAAFGLDQPVTRVTVTAKSGTLPVIAVGKNTAIGGKTYVRKGDEAKVYLTPSTIGFGLNKQVKDLRDKQILAFQDDDVKKVEIAAAGAPVVTVTRKDKDAWTIDPGDYAADPTEVRSYLSTLRSTRATDFPDDAPADLGKYGLGTPQLTVSVFTGKDGAEQQSLLLGAASTEGTTKLVYAKRANGPTVYSLGEWTQKNLAKTVGALRDKTVLGFDAARIGKVVLTRKDGTAVTMVRSDKGDWQLEGPDASKAKPTTIERFVDDVHDLRGADVVADGTVDLAAWSLTAPDLRIALTDKEQKPVGTILAARHEGKYYVAREGGTTVFEVRDYMFTRLDKQPRDFTESVPAPSPAVGAPTATMPMPTDMDGGGDGPDDEDGE
jgi:hypothetical protein